MNNADTFAEFIQFKDVQAATGNTSMSYRGRLAVINDMFLSLVLPKRQEDIACCLFGAQTPVLLRRRVDEDGILEVYQLVGTCYVQGAMLEELSGFFKDNEEDFVLY